MEDYSQNKKIDDNSYDGRLGVKTRGITGPYGKENVYFSCHPKDFELYFEQISNEIFGIQNCAIWYNKDFNKSWDKEELEIELGEMNLFVVPITSRFLDEPSIGRDIEFNFAIDHNIPILPLIQENGLEEKFNRNFGYLQCLDRSAISKDLTAIPYKEKLEKFLFSTLLDDKLTQSVRDEFTAYIFMSYRKIDRRLEQELMHMIHRNDFCRDIATWYDEFIDLGENFNESIEKAIKKSSLVTLVVTPNVLNPPDNYVAKEEYESVKENKKPIIPVEMVSTNRDLLEKVFDELLDPIKANDNYAFTDALRRQFYDFSHNNEPEHLYHIGLAYLNGIDVEKDSDRALKLITTAAEGNVTSAMTTLSDMYKFGRGVEKNLEQSAIWLERLANFTEDKFNESRTEEDGYSCCESLGELGDAWDEAGEREKSENVYEKMFTLSRRLKENFGKDRDYQIEISSCINLGKIKREKSEFENAIDWNLKGLDLIEKLSRENNTKETFVLKVSLYNNLTLLYWEIGDLKEAMKWGRETLKFSEELSRKTDAVSAYQIECGVCCNLGGIFTEGGNLDLAKELCQRALDLNEGLLSETRQLLDCARDRLSIFAILTKIYQREGNLNKARELCQTRLEFGEKLGIEMGIGKVNEMTVSVYKDLFQISFDEGDFSKAKEHCLKGREQSEELINQTCDKGELLRIASFDADLGQISLYEEDFKEARRYYIKALNVYEEQSQKTDISYPHMEMDRVLIYQGLAEVSLKEKKRDEAKENCLKALKLSDGLNKKIATLDLYTTQISLYEILGEISYDEGDLFEAKRRCLEGLKLGEQLNMSQGIPYVRMHMIYIYALLSEISVKEEDSYKIKECCFNGLNLCKQLYKDLHNDFRTKGIEISMIAFYGFLSQEYMDEGDLGNAKKQCLNGLDLIRKIGTEKENAELLKEAVFLNKLFYLINIEEGNIKEGKNCCQEGLKLGKQFCKNYGKDPGLVDVRMDMLDFYIALGEINMSGDESDISKDMFQEALKLSEELSPNMSKMGLYEVQSRILDGLVESSHDAGDFSDAIDFCLEELNICEKQGQEPGSYDALIKMTEVYNKLGNINYEDGKYDEAINSFQQGIVSCENLDEDLCGEDGVAENYYENYYTLGTLYINLGQTYYKQNKNDFDKSKECFSKGLETQEKLCIEVISEEKSIGENSAFFLNELASSYFLCGTFDEKHLDISMLKNAEDIWEILTKLFPDKAEYKEKLEAVQVVLKEGL